MTLGLFISLGGHTSAEAASGRSSSSVSCRGGYYAGYKGLRIDIADVAKITCAKVRTVVSMVGRRFQYGYPPVRFSISSFRCSRYLPTRVSGNDAYLCVYGSSRVIFTTWLFEGD